MRWCRTGRALEVVDRCEADGTTDCAAYKRVNRQFSQQHMLRSRPVPACFKAAAAKSGDAYGVMWGPSEFSCTGNLRDWSVQERLHEINVPTLITCGRHDESTYKINLGLRRGIKNSSWKIFEKSAHMAHLEEPDRYIRELQNFLVRSDRQAPR